MTTNVGVTNFGRVLTSRGRLSFGTLRESKQCIIGIKRKLYMVHRLVALAFLAHLPHDIDAIVYHKDGNPSNNRADNLQWMSLREAKISRDEREKQTGVSHQNRPSCSKVVFVRRRGATEWTRYASLAEMQRITGLSSYRVSARLRGLHPGWLRDYEFKRDEEQNFEGETWADLKLDGTETKWRVSNYGRVSNSHGIVSVGCKHDSGYHRVLVAPRKRFSVHYLVMMAFGPPKPSPLHTVNHIDGNKSNNHIDNLEWATPSEQLRHAVGIKRKRTLADGGVFPSLRVEGRPVGSEHWTEYASTSAAAKAVSVRRVSVIKAIGRSGTSGGYEWRYCKESLMEGEILVFIDLNED